MNDATDARIAKHLESIDRSMKELVKVFATFNENFVGFVKKLEQSDNEEPADDPNQLSLDTKPPAASAETWPTDPELLEDQRRLQVRTRGGTEDWRSEHEQGYKEGM